MKSATGKSILGAAVLVLAACGPQKSPEGDAERNIDGHKSSEHDHAHHDHGPGHDHDHGSQPNSGSTDWSALTGETPASAANAAPQDPVWSLLPAALASFDLQYQVRPLSPSDIEAAHATLGPVEARECAELVASCQTQFGVGGQGAQLAVMGLYAFAHEGDADRFLELLQKENRQKDAQVQQGGEVLIAETQQLDIPPDLGKGLDYRKVVRLPHAEVPVRSMYVVQDRHLVEVTLSNLTLEDAALHDLVRAIFATRQPR